MAELATIARPYAEALFKARANGDAAALAGELQALADVAANPQLRQFADNPKIDPDAGLRRCSPASPAGLGRAAQRRRRRTCCAP